MQNTIDLTPVINAGIFLLAAIVSAFVLPWIRSYVLPWLEANTNEKQRNALGIAVRTAVYAAEQMYGAGNGYEKMQHVKEYLRKRGVEIDVDLIEATVKEHFGHIDLDGLIEEDEEEPEEDEEPQTQRTPGA